MGPVILARAGLRFAIKVHGSDLSYVVRPHPERFVPYALEGTDAAAGILAGSSHTAQILYETVPDPTLPGRTRLGPPGVDVHRFHPHEPAEARRNLELLARRLDSETPAAGEGQDSFGRDGPGDRGCPGRAGRGGTSACSTSASSWSARASICSPPPGRWSIASGWPRAHRHPGCCSPASAPSSRACASWSRRSAVATSRPLSRVAARGRGYEGDDDAPLPILTGFLTDPPDGYARPPARPPGRC